MNDTWVKALRAKYVKLPYGAGSVNEDQAQQLFALLDGYDRERYSPFSYPWMAIVRYDAWALWAWPGGGYTMLRDSWELDQGLSAKTFEDLLIAIRDYYEEEK